MIEGFDTLDSAVGLAGICIVALVLLWIWMDDEGGGGT